MSKESQKIVFKLSRVYSADSKRQKDKTFDAKYEAEIERLKKLY